jgi:hypothetical protein
MASHARNLAEIDFEVGIDFNKKHLILVIREKVYSERGSFTYLTPRERGSKTQFWTKAEVLPYNLRLLTFSVLR